MDMTGDPNQRNPSMFSFEGLCRNPTLNLPQFNEGISRVNPRLPTNPNENSVQNMFGSTSISTSPFSVNNWVDPFPSVPSTSGYVFPSTSSFNSMPSPGNRSFPFPQAGISGDSSTTFPESSPFDSSAHIPNPFGNSKTNWVHAAKPIFNFSTKPSNSGLRLKPLAGTFGCKRKTESPPLPPLKQHITEERMAEHMSRLYINSETPTSSRESQPIRECRLYMCEEMQRLQAESIIPVQILERINRPCTALVPWTPPIGTSLPKENNNNEDEQDSNVMEEFDSNSADMES